MKLGLFVPSEYKCFTLVCRKLRRIVGDHHLEGFWATDTRHEVIQALASEFGVDVISLSDKSEVSHMVVFLDAFSLSDFEKNLISNFESSLVRMCRVPVTRVINIKLTHNKEVLRNGKYIGRGTAFGNPYSSQEFGGKQEAIRMFKSDFEARKLPTPFTIELCHSELLGRHIACSCKPTDCHGDIYADYLNRLDHEGLT